MKIRDYVSSSIGKKQIVALTGLALIFMFLIPHLFGNMILLKGPEAYNGYSSILHASQLILRLLETLFGLLFVIHISFTGWVVIENFIARKNRYKGPVVLEAQSLASKTMPYTGAIILVYLIIHIRDYTLASPVPPASVWHGADLGLYGLVVNSFANPWRLAFYTFAMIVAGFHLSHALQSALQTFNLRSERYVLWFNLLSYVLGVSVAAGFIYIIMDCVFGAQ